MEKNYKFTGFADEISDNLEIQIESLKTLGMRYVEMRGADGKNIIHHDNEKVREIKKRLDDNGIALSAVGSPLGKIKITDPFEDHFEEFKRGVEVAHMMDAEYIRMFSFYIPEGKGSEYKAEVFDRLGQFADYASGNDIVLLHENEKGIYGEKAKECREILDEFGCKSFKAIFDFANFVQAKQDTLEAYELLKDYVAYIHVKDAKWEDGRVVPAGYGDGNLAKIFNSLFASGFDGFLSLEPHLFHFKGFDLLEEGTAFVPRADKELSGFEAFSLAKESLEKILRY